MLRDEHGLSIVGKPGNDIRRLPLEGRDKFCSHHVILKYHSKHYKYFMVTEKMVRPSPPIES